MSDNNDDGDFRSFLAGFVIGGLVGAAVALVMAPQSGAETRSRITGKGHEMADASEERYHAAVESAEAYSQYVGERASQVGHDAKEKARIVLDEGLQESAAADDEESATTADSGDEEETEAS